MKYSIILQKLYLLNTFREKWIYLCCCITHTSVAKYVLGIQVKHRAGRSRATTWMYGPGSGPERCGLTRGAGWGPGPGAHHTLTSRPSFDSLCRVALLRVASRIAREILRSPRSFSRRLGVSLQCFFFFLPSAFSNIRG